jgi:hypothetical protein
MACWFGPSQINTKSLDAYWEITKKIKSGELVTEQDWETLLASDGYRLYIKNNGIDVSTVNIFKEKLTAACLLEENDSLSALYKKDRWVQQLARTISLQSETTEHVDKLQTMSYLDSMKVLAYKYLPVRLIQFEYQDPTIYFLVFDYDGSANIDGIFMNPLLSFDLDQPKIGAFAAHELHHFIMDQYSKNQHQSHIDSTDRGAIWAIKNVANEGIANMVDKKYVLSEASNYQDKEWYLEKLKVAPKSVEEINSSLEKLSSFADSKLYGAGYWQGVILGNGHFPGYFMACAIEDAGFHEELKQTVDNPFQFFFLYNKAARSAGNKYPVFSDQAISLLRDFEKKYFVK